MKRTSLSLALSIFIGLCWGMLAEVRSQMPSKTLVRIVVDQKSDLDKLSDLDLDYAYRGLEHHVDIFVADQELAMLEALGFSYQILPALTTAHLYDSEYHSYEAMVHLLDSLHRAYPTITSLHQIGVSQQMGLPIWAMKISDHAALDEDEFTVNYDGMHHAREPMGMETCLVLIDHLLGNYGVVPEITAMIDSIEIWITPMVNPEGYKYIVDNRLGSPWWRKNLRDNNGNSRFDAAADGVDLNRNYDYYFSSGGSGTPSSWTYRGPHAFSESEIAARRDLFLRERFLASITYHSYAEEIYYMRGLLGSLLPETPLLDAFADSIAARIPKLDRSGHYRAGGSTNSTNMSYPWTFAVVGVYEVLIETGTEFIPPGDIGRQVAVDNLHGALYLLEKTLRGPGIRGHVTDAVTKLPLIAAVKIVEYDRSSMTPRQTEAQFGRFHRFAAAGKYTLQVSAPGYQTQTVLQVMVPETGWSDVEISLEPANTRLCANSQSSPPAAPQLMQNYPNPFNQQTVIDYTLPANSYLKLAVWNLQGQLIRVLASSEQSAGSHAVTWDGRDSKKSLVSSGIYLVAMEVVASDTGERWQLVRKMILAR